MSGSMSAGAPAGPADPAVPTLSLRTYLEGDATVVHCSGNLIHGLTYILRDEVKPLIPQCKKIVLDLTELNKLDSMGLGSIVALYVSAKASGTALILINLSPKIRDIFRITNLWSVLEVYGENIIRMP